MKLETLVNSKTALENFIANPLPVSMSWPVKLFVNVTNPELKSYEEIKFSLIKELGEPHLVDGQEGFKVTDANFPEYQKQIKELLEKEIDVIIPKIKKANVLSYRTLKDREIELSVDDLALLDWLIVE